MNSVRRSISILFGAMAFAVAYTQAPLYYSNQNQYFLHGLASANRGELKNDWLANTASPTPAFDALVSFTARYGHESFFYVYYALLLGLYFCSLMGLFEFLAGDRATPSMKLGFAALLIALHSAFLRWASYRLFDADYLCYAQGWLAAQYVLGPVFQPSTFGVFLIFAIERFVRGRHFNAFTALALAGIGHSTYLLPGAILTISFACILAGNRHWQRAILLPLWTLILVLPGVIHGYWNFAPTNQESFAEAQRILAEIRIPHHCDPRRWCDAITWAQVGLMLAGILSVWRTKLFPILATLFTASAVLTIVELATRNHSLSLLFPWRSSVILLPIAVTALLAHVVLLVPRMWESPIAKWASISCIAFFCIAGGAIIAFRGGYATNKVEEPLMKFVRLNLQPGDCYLLPVSVPNPQGAKGSISSDFKPLPAQKADGRLIPLDFQRFRIATGAPIFIDFKAIPYKDTDVLEWYRRVTWNQRLYSARKWDETDALAELKAAKVTHVIVAKDKDVVCDDLTAIYEDDSHKIYRLK